MTENMEDEANKLVDSIMNRLIKYGNAKLVLTMHPRDYHLLSASHSNTICENYPGKFAGYPIIIDRAQGEGRVKITKLQGKAPTG